MTRRCTKWVTNTSASATSRQVHFCKSHENSLRFLIVGVASLALLVSWGVQGSVSKGEPVFFLAWFLGSIGFGGLDS